MEKEAESKSLNGRKVALFRRQDTISLTPKEGRMDTAVLAQMELFSGLDQEEIGRVLACLNAHTRSYQRGEVICPMGQPTDYIGLVLKGTILVEYQDAWGKRSLLTPVGTGKTFSEVFAFIPDESLPVSVVAASNCRVLRMQAGKLTQVCRQACTCHNQLISNLLRIMSQRSIDLMRRVFHTSHRTIRARLMSYLSLEAIKAGSRTFTIPYNRQQLADYLGVDRSALSNELGKMRREGLLETTKNQFKLSENVEVPDE